MSDEIFVRARQCGKNGWNSFWTMVEISVPELKEELLKDCREYMLSGNFSVGGFLKYLENLE